MEYNEAKFLYPPRPEDKILPDHLPFYEKHGWWAQIKKNGTCSILGVGPTGEIYTQTRHGEDHKLWKPSEESLRPFKDRANGKWRVYVVEVLDAKTSHIKDTIYIHDIIVNDGTILEGTTFAERQDLLLEIFPEYIGEGFGYNKVTEKVWLATIIKHDFKWVFDSINDPKVDEGLVIKDPKQNLTQMWRKGSNVSWQLKCRKPTKNYGY
jgi:ATP-dependent DNA ligase